MDKIKLMVSKKCPEYNREGDRFKDSNQKLPGQTPDYKIKASEMEHKKKKETTIEEYKIKNLFE